MFRKFKIGKIPGPDRITGKLLRVCAELCDIFSSLFNLPIEQQKPWKESIIEPDATCHLEGTKTHVRHLFIDFSSAFNTILPLILANKLLSLFNLDVGIVRWIVDYIYVGPRIRVNDALSQQCLLSTGATQGYVFSPLLYIRYTKETVTSRRTLFIIGYRIYRHNQTEQNRTKLKQDWTRLNKTAQS